MDWFKHDTKASFDAKVKKLIIRHGAVGYAVYFHCLELIMADVSKTNITFELEHDSEIIADNLKIIGTNNEAGVDIVNRIMRTIIELNLFECSQNRIFCLKLLDRLDSSMTSNSKFRAKITELKDLRDKNTNKVMIPSWQHHDTVMQEENKNKKSEEEKESEENQKAPSSPLESLMKLWNDSGLPNCGMIFNLSNPNACLDGINGFGEEYTSEAIRNLSKHKAEIGQKYIPSFQSFMTNGKIGVWHDWQPEQKEKVIELSEDERMDF